VSGKWSIDVLSSRAVIAAARSAMAGLEDELSVLDAAVGGVTQAVPAAVVQQAFAEAMSLGVEPEVRGMLASSNAALDAASMAISHYENGDLAMAATAMRSAVLVEPAWGARANPDE
jgi:Family of unknown function (DUF6507)